MKRRLILCLLVATVLPLVGCGSKSDDYDSKNIAVKQPGSGPPPMNSPMSGSKDQATGGR